MGRQRTPAELVGTPLLKAVANVLLFQHHRWQPSDDHKKRELRRPGHDGGLTAEALDFIDQTARVIVAEFGAKEPQDPIEHACHIAAVAYLAALGGAPFHDDVFGAGIGHHIQDAMNAAQRHEAAENGKSGGRDWGQTNQDINRIIAGIIAANPGKTDADLLPEVYEATRHLNTHPENDKYDKALLARIRRRRKKLSEN